MKELRAVDVWGIDTVRHVHGLAIVPLIGDGIADSSIVVGAIGREIARTKGSKVLTVSTATLIPVKKLVNNQTMN